MAGRELVTSTKIAQVAAGEAHTIILTDAGQVFTWGRGFFGRLGTGTDADEAVPVIVPISTRVSPDTSAPHKVVAVAAGAYHSLALADDGAVWSWGYNIYGQLGHDEEINSIPHPVSLFARHTPEEGLSATLVRTNVSSEEDNQPSGKPVKVVDVEAGGMMSCAIDESGCLWMWGRCPLIPGKQSSDPFLLSSIERPQLVRCFQDMSVSKVACGNEHVLALIDRGSCTEGESPLACYAWGSNTYGQLGLGDRVSRLCPEHVKSLDCQLVGTLSHIACGAFHSVIITHQEQQPTKIGVEGIGGETLWQTLEGGHNSESYKRISVCWTFGMGGNGQLGHGTSEDLTLPKLVQGLPEQAKLSGVACGLFHTGILTEAGDIWVWGMEKGLGLCPGIGPPGTGVGDALYPVQVIGNGSPIDIDTGHKKLACGAAHTVVIASKGSKLWSWGRGQSGVLGTGDMADSLFPCQVVWPPPYVGDQKHFGQETEIPRDDSISNLTVETQYTQDIDGPENLLGVAEMEKKLAAAEAEIWSLKSDLSAAKRYATSLRLAIYGMQERGESKEESTALQEWERTIDEATYTDLAFFEAFYHKMRSRVKEVMLQRRIDEHCRQFMKPLQGERKEVSDDSTYSTRYAMFG